MKELLELFLSKTGFLVGVGVGDAELFDFGFFSSEAIEDPFTSENNFVFDGTKDGPDVLSDDIDDGLVEGLGELSELGFEFIDGR